MIQTTSTDFKANLGKTSPKSKRNCVDDLIGVVPNADIDEKQMKAERLAQKYESLN